MDLLIRAGCSPRVIRHCCTVRALAMEIAARCDADVELVSAGAMLHDIGRARTHRIDHMVAGANIARDLGLSEEIVGIIESHVGAGIDAAEAKNLGLPERDYVPHTLEARIVAHADNLVGNDRFRTLDECQQTYHVKGKDSLFLKVEALHRELSEVAGEDLDAMVLRMRGSVFTGPCARYISRYRIG